MQSSTTIIQPRAIRRHKRVRQVGTVICCNIMAAAAMALIICQLSGLVSISLEVLLLGLAVLCISGGIGVGNFLEWKYPDVEYDAGPEGRWAHQAFGLTLALLVVGGLLLMAAATKLLA